MKFKPMKSYVVHVSGVDIYLFHIFRNFVYFKYGKNDNVASQPFNSHNFDYDNIKVEEISITHEGMKDIPQSILKDVLDGDDITIELVQEVMK